MQQRLLNTIKNYLEDLKSFDHDRAKEKECYLKEVEEENIVSERLRRMIHNWMLYYMPKDKKYALYLRKLSREV